MVRHGIKDRRWISHLRHNERVPHRKEGESSCQKEREDMLDKQNPEVPDPGQISTSFLTSICIPYGQGPGGMGRNCWSENTILVTERIRGSANALPTKTLKSDTMMTKTDAF